MLIAHHQVELILLNCIIDITNFSVVFFKDIDSMATLNRDKRSGECDHNAYKIFKRLQTQMQSHRFSLLNAANVAHRIYNMYKVAYGVALISFNIKLLVPS